MMMQVMLISRENLNRVAELHHIMKELEVEYEICKDQLKKEMVAAGVNKLDADGIYVTIAEASRTTIAKDAVDKLYHKGLVQCLDSTVAVNVNKLKQEVGRTLTVSEFREMVKETPYQRMTIK